MKKTIVLALLTPLVFFGQVKTGIIKYKALLSEYEGCRKNDILSNAFENQKKATETMSFSLIFNEQEMIFTRETDYDNVMIVSSKGTYYKDKHSPLVLNERDEYDLGIVCVERNQKKDWVLSNETKKIDDYLCFKATATYTLTDNGDPVKINLVAWYCPKIPVSFGPNGYNGLPGLILELQENNVVFGAVAIDLNPKILQKIEKPTKGKVVSELEFKKIVDDYIAEMTK